jgi:putative PIN family toxin of toxin-antitoxin system
MTPPVCVVDTNVLVAGLITNPDQSPVAWILDAMLSGKLVYLLSPELLDEYRAVLLRPKLTTLHGLSDAEVDRLLVEMAANAMWREPQCTSPAPDPGDDHLWALMDSLSGSMLITGDRVRLENPAQTGSVIFSKTCVERFLSG